MKLIDFAPLPFHGQKRNFLRLLIESVNMLKLQRIVNENTFFLDVFGGSGLISNNLRLNFKNRIIYNDFDNYSSEIHKTLNTYKFLNLIKQILPAKERLSHAYSRYYYLNETQRKFVFDMIDTYAHNLYIPAVCMNFSVFNIEKDLENLKKKKKELLIVCQ